MNKKITLFLLIISCINHPTYSNVNSDWVHCCLDFLNDKTLSPEEQAISDTLDKINKRLEEIREEVYDIFVKFMHYRSGYITTGCLFKRRHFKHGPYSPDRIRSFKPTDFNEGSEERTDLKRKELLLQERNDLISKLRKLEEEKKILRSCLIYSHIYNYGFNVNDYTGLPHGTAEEKCFVASTAKRRLLQRKISELQKSDSDIKMQEYTTIKESDNFKISDYPKIN